MLAEPQHLDTATRIGVWLATYWVHAAVAIGVTFALTRTVLRHVPAAVRASAWRAALVAPLVTSAVRCEWIADGFHLEVAWLGRATAVATDTVESPSPATAADRIESDRQLATARGIDAATITGRPSSARASDADASIDGADARGDGAEPTLHGQRLIEDAASTGSQRSGDGSMRDASRSVATSLDGTRPDEGPSEQDAGTGTSGGFASTDPNAPSGGWALGGLDPRRVALFVAAGAALLALARWLDGWLRLGRRLGTRRALAPEHAERAAHLAASMGVPRTRITASEQVRVPMAFGFLRPQVCLPIDFDRGLTAAEWDAALAHELAHVVRGDQRWLPALRLVTRLFAFQPLNRLAWNQLERESEHAADEMAVGTTGAATPLALCLAKVATRVAGDRRVLSDAAITGAPTMAARASLVIERTDRLIASATQGPRRHRPLARVLAFAPSLVVALLAPRLAPASGLTSTDTAIDPTPVASAIPVDVGTATIENAADERDPTDGATVERPIADLALDIDATATASPATSSSLATAGVLEMLAVLAAEIDAAGNEIATARASIDPTRRASLDELTQRLALLQGRFDRVLELIAATESGAFDDLHGPGARASAPRSTASPTFVPERDIER